MNQRIQRIIRRLPAIAAGLVLGWLAAGQLDVNASSASHDAPPVVAGTDGKPHSVSHPHPKADAQTAEQPSTQVAPAAEEHAPNAHAAPVLRGWLLFGVGLIGASLVIGGMLRRSGVADPGTLASEQDRHAAHHQVDHDHAAPAAGGAHSHH